MSAAIDIVELSASLEGKYAEFVGRVPMAMIYGTLEFRAFLQRVVAGTPTYFVAVQGERIVGALPCFMVRHERCGTVINSLPWYGSHGGCVLVSEHDETARRRLLARYAEWVAEQQAAFATLILTPRENQHLEAYREALAPSATDGRVGQMTRLPDDGPDLEQRLERVCRQKTRNLIRKSLKQGFALAARDDDDAWRFLHGTHVENMAAIGGRAKPWAHFAALRDTIPAAWRQLLVTTLDGRPVAALLLLRFNGIVEYITPVIAHEFRSRQPLSFTIWHAMLDAVHRGDAWWNWGGTWTTQVSLHHFKEGWGATEWPYTYLTTAHPDALRDLQQDRRAVLDAFPHYFIYPFPALVN